MIEVLVALVPVFLIIALGVVLRHTLLREDAHWRGLERLTYFVLFPALLMVSLARTDLGGVAVLEVSAALLGAIALMTLALLGCRVAICRVLALSGPSFTSFAQGALRWNTYVGLAVAGGLAGPAGLAVAAVAIAVIIPSVNVLSVVILARYAGSGQLNGADVFRQIARNPFIWSCAAGALINVLHLPTPPVLVTFADILGRASLALGLLVVGAGLVLSDLRRPHAATWWAAVLKLLVLPALAVTIGRFCGLGGVDLLVVAIAAAVPSAPNGYVLARQMGGDAPLLAQMLTLQTLLSAITLPLVIAAVQLL
ncbi:MAG TPA: AEC family transporter [Xanthobacteraceae bacterium]|nr:AEC family transporter [Xanthobacteraceae bacterium]